MKSSLSLGKYVAVLIAALCCSFPAFAQFSATVPTTMQQVGGNPVGLAPLLDRQIFLAYSTTPDVYDTIVIGTVSHGNLSYSLTGGGGTAGVSSFNTLTGAVSLVAGANIALSTTGDVITISATAASAGVSSLNSLTGAVSLVAGTGVSFSTSGSAITINATGSGSSGVSSVTYTSAATGALTLGSSSSVSIVQTGSTFTWQLPGIVSAATISNPVSLQFDTYGRVLAASAGVVGTSWLPSQSGVASGDVLTTNGTTATWQAPATGGSSPTIARFVIPFLQGKTPTSTGADTYEYVLPYAPGGVTLYFTGTSPHLRIQTPASSGTTTVKMDWSSSTGAWSSINTSYGASVPAGDYEPAGTQPAWSVTTSTPKSGDKLRATVTSLGTGAAGITYEVEFEVSTTDPL